MDGWLDALKPNANDRASDGWADECVSIRIRATKQT